MLSQLTCIIGFGSHVQFWTVTKIPNSDVVYKINIVVHVLQSCTISVNFLLILLLFRFDNFQILLDIQLLLIRLLKPI